MPRYEIQAVTDDNGDEFFSIVDLLDLSGNNEVAAFWTRHEAVKFVAISNEWQDIDPSAAVSLLDEEDRPYLSYSARLAIWIFFYGGEAGSGVREVLRS